MVGDVGFSIFVIYTLDQFILLNFWTDINSNNPVKHDSSPDARAPTPPLIRGQPSTIIKSKMSNTAACEPEQGTQSDPTQEQY